MAQDGPNPVTEGAALEARDLVFAYRPGARVLDGLSMEAPAGRLVAILGPNGSGKTTLLRLALGLLAPQAGEVRFAGRPLPHWPRPTLAKHVAYVPQETRGPTARTVLETVLLGRSPHTGLLGFETEADWTAAREALALTGTEAFADRPLDELSGGERQRVIVARALAQQPAAVLLDEPTSFLDIRHQHAIYGLLARLVRERGLTVVTVSHDLNLAAAYADRVVLVRAGQVAASGPPAEVLRAERLSEVYETPVEVRTDDATGRPYVMPRPPT